MQKELLAEARRRRIPTNVPFRDLKTEHQRFVLDGGDGYYGVKGFFDWLQSKKYKVQVRVLLSRYRKYVACPACAKTRLNARALSVRIKGLNIGEVVRMTVGEASDFFAGLELEPVRAPGGRQARPGDPRPPASSSSRSASTTSPSTA